MKKEFNPDAPFKMSVDVRTIEKAEKVEAWLRSNGYLNITRVEACGIGTGMFYNIKFSCPDITEGEMAALAYIPMVERYNAVIRKIKEGIR